MSRLDIYRARYRRWRAERGSVEWHRATAEIREHNGDLAGCWAHAAVALVKEKVRGLLQVMNSLLEASRGTGVPS